MISFRFILVLIGLAGKNPQTEPSTRVPAGQWTLWSLFMLCRV